LAQPAPGESIVALTGAGVSAASGLPTFRGAGGLWEGHRVEEVATPGAFARDPVLVHRFYNERRARQRDPAIRPNAAHLAWPSWSGGGRGSSCWSRRTSTTCTSVPAAAT
jgi:NAD-dependent SIR2 family protein deacetylase